MHNTSIVAMQQQDVSGPPKPCEIDNKDLESNIDENNVPEGDSSFIKEETSIDNENPLLKTPQMEESIAIETRKSTVGDGLCTNDKLEDAIDKNDSQYCQLQAEVENGKDLTDQQGICDDDNDEQIVVHNVQIDEENVEVTVDETVNHCEANGYLEETEKDDCVSSNCEPNLTEGEDTQATEDVANEIVSNGETDETEPVAGSSTVNVSSHEVPLPKSREDSEDELRIAEDCNVSSPGNGSWGGKIRSVSARRPVRKPSVPPENLLAGRSRSSTPCNLTPSKAKLVNDTYSSMTENLFASLKRKALDNESSITPKKSRICDPQNSTFLSMVSSPLRLLKNKISDRIIESHKDTCEEKHINGSSEDDNEECEAKFGVEITEKKPVVAENKGEDNNSFRSWCSIM